MLRDIGDQLVENQSQRPRGVGLQFDVFPRDVGTRLAVRRELNGQQTFQPRGVGTSLIDQVVGNFTARMRPAIVSARAESSSIVFLMIASMIA